MARDLEVQFRRLGESAAGEYEAKGARQQRNKEIDLSRAADEDLALVSNIMLGLQRESLVGGVDFDGGYQKTLAKTHAAIESEFSLGVNLNDGKLEREVLALGGTRRGLSDLPAQTRSAIFSAIEQARELGLGPPATASRIRDLVAAGPWADSRTRALMVARTETKFAQNASSMAIYREAETVSSVQVFDAQLGDTDAGCQALNGRIFTLEEAQKIPLLDHPNCTRSFAPVVGAG